MASLLSSQPSGHGDHDDDNEISYTNLDISIDTEISILKMGTKFTYRIPSFSVLTADIRHIRYQVVAIEGTMLIFDGFIRADSSLEPAKETPFTVKLQDFCCVTVNL